MRSFFPPASAVAGLGGPVVALLAALGASTPASRAQQQGQPPPACPESHEDHVGAREPLVCHCDAEATRRGSVWGTDTYTSHSGVCRAALHAGAVAPGGGAVTVAPAPGSQSFRGTLRNGVQSGGYSGWAANFRFERAPALAALGEAQTGAREPPQPDAAASPAPGQPPSQCADNFVAYRGEADPLTCACPAEAAGRGAVWGLDVYAETSSICRAALHAGAIGRRGGAVTVVAQPGRRAYPGLTRRGVQSLNHGAAEGSFSFRPDPAAQRQAQPAAPPQPFGQCPDDFEASKGDPEPLTCACPAEATLSGVVRGSDIYSSDSRICRAALHAGAVGRGGGRVTVTPLPGRHAYPGSTRNGVQSRNYGAWDDSFRVQAAPEGAASPALAPAQAPVVQARRAAAQAQLYVTFRAGSADLDAAAVPVLAQVREAMLAEPSLRLRLIGHTDNTGTAAGNGTLSLRRAEAVRAWLVGLGINAARLDVDGRGQDEPIADNASEAGRVLNRRVQAVRIR